MGLQGAEAEDAESMFVEQLLEQKCSKFGQGTLATIIPMVVCILKEPGKYSDPNLQLACSMCLIRCMCLSQGICTEHLQLIFTLMKKSPYAMIRSQLIIAVGDLVYRFPNTLEPWTNHLYLPLRDTKSVEVRMNTIRVLSHLILKEMIKTRGQMYEIALCTVDTEPQISSLAKLFFTELSNRNNGLVIYNAMPDMISQLSGGGGATKNNNKEDHFNAREISEESFRSIATFLFNFIKRDKQCETLLEKLCQGFRQATTSERKCRDLAFCLSKVQLSENGIKKLKENFKFYADKLAIPYVYETFKQSILKNARKLPNLKNEVKLLIDELEKKIEDVRQKGLSEDMINNVATPSKNHDNDDNDDEQDDENNDDSEAIPVSTQRPRNTKQVATAAASKTTKASSGGKKGATKSKAGSKNKNSKSNVSRARRKVIESSSDEKEDENDESNEDSEPTSDSD
jgi:condensin complex subunit 1